MSLTKPIEESGSVFTLLVILFGVLVYSIFGLGVYYFIQDRLNIYFLILLIMTSVGYFVIPFCIHICNITHRIKYLIAIPILLFLTPMYINIIMIYSISNLQDISWGNRKTDDYSKDDTRRNLEQFRVISLVIWMSINAAYGYGIEYLSETKRRDYIVVLTVSDLHRIIVSFI